MDRDEVLLIDDWRLTRDAEIASGFESMMDWSHGGRMGNWITINGRGDVSLPVRRNERLRLRLVNTANARIFTLELKDLRGWIIALDGQPLKDPEPAGRMILAPAQRIDLIVDVTTEQGTKARLLSLNSRGEQPIAVFEVSGEARGNRLGDPTPLAPNDFSDPAVLPATHKAKLRMEGGAMGSMRGAMMDGQMMGMRKLADARKFWALNSVANMPAKPLLIASAGESVQISMINDTVWPHAMHLHGHHFRKIGADGHPGPLRDTLLVNRNETEEICFIAYNPGDWLLHCHMLEHSAGGMMTWIRVS